MGQETGGPGGEQGPRHRGVLVFRWAVLAWMVALDVVTRHEFRREWLVWTGLGVAVAWTLVLTLRRPRYGGAVLWVDLGIAAALVLGSGLVSPEGAIESRPFYATAYPVSAALAWGAATGLRGGLFAGTVLSLAHVGSRLTNGIPPGRLTGLSVFGLVNASLTYLLAGGALGYVSELLDRSALALAGATDELVRERERAARLAERESLGRQIHDSVLQALAMVNRRGRQLAERGAATPQELGELAGLAGEQEVALRRLIARPAEEGPAATLSLRAALEALATGGRGVPVEVSSVGAIWLDGHAVRELTAAVGEALTNVARHAGAGRAVVFAEEQDREVVVSVRDDGCGFEFDAGKLAAANKFGLLRSMKGRIEELGGRMEIESAPGRGTEVTFRLPRGAHP
ncbi:MAG: sensor histidine kinase [Actinomycetota bacterium]